MDISMLDISVWKYINIALLVISLPLTFFVYRMSLQRNSLITVDPKRRASYLRRAVAYLIDLVICLNIAWLIIKGLTIINFAHWQNAFALLFTGSVFLYFVVLESSNLRGTLGKFSLGLEIVNNNGTGMSLSKTTLRLFINIVIGMCFPLMNIVIFLTKYRQCSFEVITNTLVVKKDQK